MSNLVCGAQIDRQPEHIATKTAHVQVVFGGQNVIVNGKRFQFARNYTDVKEFELLLKELEFAVTVTHNY